MMQKLAEVRRKRGVSQGELARRVGATLSMIGKLERGERAMTFSWLSKIAVALHVRPEELLERSGRPQCVGDVLPSGAVVSPDGSRDIRDFPLEAKSLIVRDTFNGYAAPGGRSLLLDQGIALQIPNGSELVFETPGRPPDREWFGQFAIIWLVQTEGPEHVSYEPFAGRLLPGSKESRFHILRLDGSMIEDADVYWLALINAIHFR